MQATYYSVVIALCVVLLIGFLVHRNRVMKRNGAGRFQLKARSRRGSNSEGYLPQAPNISGLPPQAAAFRMRQYEQELRAARKQQSRASRGGRDLEAQRETNSAPRQAVDGGLVSADDAAQLAAPPPTYSRTSPPVVANGAVRPTTGTENDLPEAPPPYMPRT